MILTLCSLLSFVPASVVAVEGTTSSNPTEPTIITYDFQLENTNLTTTAGASFTKAQLTGTGVSGAIPAYYRRFIFFIISPPMNV